MKHGSKSGRKLRVLVVDDSAHNRRAITQALSQAPDVEVVERAADGEEGLRKVHALKPDVITLDLEMPRLDGFTFLRLLMAHDPTPVIVVSSWAHRTDVFKALELGAVDFVAKPAKGTSGDLAAVGEELLEKVRGARSARSRVPAEDQPEGPPRVVCIAASTGGPPAIQRLLEAVAAESSLALLIAQHMPPRFTHAFAERLNRVSAFRVKEAEEGDRVKAAHAYIAPGGRHLELSRRAGALRLTTPEPASGDKHAPSGNRLFESAARLLGPDALGVILTGMGSDGAHGATAIHRAGGEVWAQDEETAVVFGMPGAAVDTGAVKRVLSLEKLVAGLVSHGRRRGR